MQITFTETQLHILSQALSARRVQLEDDVSRAHIAQESLPTIKELEALVDNTLRAAWVNQRKYGN